jgi:hypothetical protein
MEIVDVDEMSVPPRSNICGTARSREPLGDPGRRVARPSGLHSRAAVFASPIVRPATI